MAKSAGKVLLIACDFPPCKSIGGSIRSEKFAKYLPGFGWQPSILALQETGMESEPEIFPGVHRTRSLTPWVQPYNVVPYGWAVTMYRKARRILQQNRHDVIYVSCPPFPQTLATILLKLHYQIPLVIDFRDVWALDPYVEGSRLKKVIYKWIFPLLENIVIRRSDVLIFNSESALLAYRSRYPDYADNMVLIPNGFDEEDFYGYDPIKSKEVMKVLYAGRFGVGDRNPELIMQALTILRNEDAPIKFTFVGDSSRELEALVNKYRLSAVTEIKKQIPHNEVVKMMGSFDILFLYQENSPSKITPIAGKTYECLRTGKPILAVCPAGDNARLIKDNCARFKLASEYRPEIIAEMLRELIRDWEKNELPAYARPEKDFEVNYNRQSLTEKLSVIFNNLCSGET